MRQLMNDIVLCGAGEDGHFTREFKNIRYIDEGASVICYEANYSHSGKGVLKEFWPKDMYALERRPNGQLMYSEGFPAACERYREKAEEYLGQYRQLLELKQNSGGDLATFIPHFEIFHGIRPDGTPSDAVYIWSPEPELESFDKICQSIHRAPAERPEQKLVTVLAGIKSLTECIKALHSAAMIHRDIKPGNFGFLKRGGKTLTQTLSMFDIDTVCSVFDVDDTAVGTEGFMDPYALHTKADNRSDIFSIGATLFYAVVITKETAQNGYIYRKEYFNRLSELVDASELITASDSNSHPRLRAALAEIMKKSLCPRQQRYRSCEELLEDLNKALFYSLPAEISSGGSLKEKWILADVESYLDTKSDRDSLLDIQCHLFRHPLYECLEKDEKALNVLAVGLGGYGQHFLDVCLQAGQMRNVDLNVTVVSDEEKDKELYLSARPGIKEFFAIDGEAYDEEPYGSIEFKTEKISANDHEENAKVIRDLICCGDKRPNYIFIAMGDDALNLSAAKACREAFDDQGVKCSINYVAENTPGALEQKGICAVRMDEDVSKSPFYAEIERLAFNVHLVWEKSMNLDYGKVRADFKKKYNHNACVANVLALKSKLHSIGIELDDFDRAARSFVEKLGDGEQGKQHRKELVWVEHKRWVVEKLTRGWQPIYDINECVSGKTKDLKRKRHVCIVKSRPDFMLRETFGNDREKWDNATAEELERFDELDRLSVELHQLYAEKAAVAKKENLLRGSGLMNIRESVESDPLPAAAFMEWYTCIKDIWYNDARKVNMYRGLRDAFVRSVKEYPKMLRKNIESRIAAFENMFYPILAGSAYVDWKEKDEELVDNIPFILTYTENTYLVVPYLTGDNNDVFSIVASATVLNPERVIYLYTANCQGDMEKLYRSLPGIIGYMKKKNLRTAVDFVVIYTAYFGGYDGAERDKIVSIGNGRIRTVKTIYAPDNQVLTEQLQSYLERRAQGKRFFAVEENKSSLSDLLCSACSFDSYGFDNRDMRFVNTNCELLNFFSKESFINVSDIASLKGLVNRRGNRSEFFDDHRVLWKKYSEDKELWKNLCGVLKADSVCRDHIAGFAVKPQANALISQTYEYIVPVECGRSAQKILEALTDTDLVLRGSKITVRTPESCEVIIIDPHGNKEDFDRLFADPYVLMFPDAVRVTVSGETEVKVSFDRLAVSGLELPGESSEAYISLLAWFAKQSYITNLRAEQNKVSFTYATPSVKGLMTSAERILEIYTYHCLKATGEFDDVVGGSEINWKTGEETIPDCIVTKGFRMLFVKCGAGEGSVDELIRFVESYGVNATAVLVTDADEKPKDAPSLVTVNRKDDIDDIGTTLMNIINSR